MKVEDDMRDLCDGFTVFFFFKASTAMSSFPQFIR